MSKIKQQIQSIQKDLFSSSDQVVLKALKNADKAGDYTLVLPMLEVYNTSIGQVKSEIKKILNQMKISKAQDIFLDAGLTEQFAEIKGDILAFIWNSGLQPNTRIHDIVTIGLSGDYMLAFESMTLIDTLEGPFDDGDLTAAIMTVRQFLSKHKTDDRIALVTSILSTLNAMDAD